jgi:iron complex transport system substrate-binding protein
MLVDKERIASITYLSQDPAYSYMWKATQGLTIHHGSAEEIIPLNPDLIIGSEFSTDNTVQIMRHLGHEVTTIISPTTLDEAETFTRRLGDLVGEAERAEQIIQTMRSDIAKAKTLVAQLPEEVAISYGPNGFTAGRLTLKNEILEAAGYRNLAAEMGIEYFGNISLEQLIWSKPDTIIIDEDIPNQNSIAQSFTTHPVLKQLLGQRKLTRMPTNYWLCPGPIASKAILTLAEQRQP